MRTFRLLGLLMLGFLAGCATEGPALTPVSGTVTLEDKPLAGARIRFIPQGQTLGHGGVGTTDADGKYEITANRSNNRKGLLPGEYKVVVSRMLMPDGSPLPADVPPMHSGARESVPERYAKVNLTPLSITIGTDPVTLNCPLQK